MIDDIRKKYVFKKFNFNLVVTGYFFRMCSHLNNKANAFWRVNTKFHFLWVQMSRPIYEV
jgi:hypothetical protein